MAGGATVAASTAVVEGTATTEAHCLRAELRWWQGGGGTVVSGAEGPRQRETTVAATRVQRCGCRGKNGWAAMAALLQWW